MGKRKRFVRKLGVAAMVALVVSVVWAPPSSAQEPPPLEPSAETVAPTDRHVADKSASGSLAQTNPELLDRTDAEPVEVMIKLDYDALAAYPGGIDGLAATSPSVTGEPLTGESDAEREYADYAATQRQAVVDELARQVPALEVGDAFDIVYGGISAVVPANQVDAVLAVEGVVAVQKNELLQPLTDSSPDFIGAPTIYDEVGGAANAGSGVIYGNLDTGIWPEHPSFEDQGNLGAPPAPPGGDTRECNYGDNPLTPETDVFECQNKLIGGAHFTDTYDQQVGDDPLEGTARDSDGHGTHTSSTSAGNPVDEAEVLGIDRGPLHGIAPGAWVMEYKVCGPQGCFSSDSAAAVQQAILDGVKAINFSISGGTQPFADPVELAFLDAYAAGVFVSASAGNSGPAANTANHLGPWTMTVGASTQTREFGTNLSLMADNGDVLTLDGASLTGGIDEPLPVVLAGATPGYADELCNTPAPAGIFEGVIVACARGGTARVLSGFNVLAGGAAGMVLYNPTQAEALTDTHWLPAVHLPDGTEFLEFMNGHGSVVGSFSQGESGDGQGDAMTAFSSRGPAGLFVKPDVTAPGAQILAGDTPFDSGDPIAGPPGEMFQAIAGTSMSSPHVAGSALLLADLHPEWTPGQIKSALMTSATTDVLKEDLATPADPFDMGAGRIDLSQAGSVPLTFNETADRFFALGNDEVNAVNLNIPSINAPVMPGRVTTTRVATNTTGRRQRFTVSTDAPQGATIEVSPRRFTLGAGESITLNVTVEAPVPGDQQFGQVNIQAGRSGQSLHLPVAFVPTQAGVNLIQNCSPASIFLRATSACTIEATNNSFTDSSVDIFTEVGRGLRVAGTDGGRQTGNRNAELTGVELAGREPGVPAVDPGSLSGYIPLDDFGIEPIGIGDEEIINFDTPAFSYAGQSWDRLGVTSNGYLVVGGGTGEDINCCNLPDGPDPARPNNVLAPLWTDLDGSEAEGILAATLTDGTNSWIVIESRLNFFGTTDQQTLQVWLGIDGTEDITFAYDPANLPADPGMAFLVGAENILGAGDVTPELPTEDLRVTSTDGVPGDTASFIVFVRGVAPGTWEVTSSMKADGVPGTTIVTSDIEVVQP